MTIRTGGAAAIAGPIGIAALFAAGLVLAASWLVALPESVVLAAWLIALTAMLAVAIAAVVESRRLGHGPVSAVRDMAGDLSRFVFYFF